MVKEDILKKSFTFDGIKSDEMRTFTCWGSVECTDRHGEIIPAEEVYKVMDIWMDRGAPIQFNHTNRGVGKGLNWQPLEKNGKPGVLITAKLHKHYAEDDTVWDVLKSGGYEGLSIDGKSHSKEATDKGTILRNLIGYEFSLVERCGNQEATMVNFNEMAKTEEKMVKEDMKKEEPVVSEEQSAEVSLGDVMEAVNSLAARMDVLESNTSGEPAVDAEKAEEETEEPAEEEEVEKEDEVDSDEEEDEMAKKLAKMEKSIATLKKSQAAYVIKTEVPEETEVKKESFESKLEAKVEEMKKAGNMSFSEVSKMIARESESQLQKKFN